MFLPRGAAIADELEKLAKETEFAAGYQRVRTPHIAREKHVQKERSPPLLRRIDVSPMDFEESGQDTSTAVPASLRRLAAEKHAEACRSGNAKS